MDFNPIILAIAQKASVSDLILAIMVIVLVYLLREERASRREDAKAMVGAVDKMAAAIEKFGDVITELRVTVAKGER